MRSIFFCTAQLMEIFFTITPALFSGHIPTVASVVNTPLLGRCLLQQKPSQRASAAQALDLLPCTALPQQQQQRQQQQSVGAEDGSETVQQHAQQKRLQQDLLHPADSSSDHACSSVDEDGVHTECDSAADCPSHLQPQEQPAGRRPWWGAPLCRQVALRFCH